MSQLVVGEGTVVQGAMAREEAAHRRRLLSLSGGVLALAALLSVLWPDTAAVEVAAHRRTSLHASADSFYALHALLRRLGYPVTQLRASYAKLPPPATAVLLCLDPLPHAELAKVYDGIETGQMRLLNDWLRAGGHVVATWPSAQRDSRLATKAARDPDGDDVLGVLCDSSAAAIPTTHFIEPKGTWRGVGDLQGTRQPWRQLAADDVDLVAAHVQKQGAGEAARVRVFTLPLPDGWRPLLWLGDAPVLLERRVGNGRAWIASSAFLFSTLALARQDLGAVLVTLLHHASDEGRRRVVFDEFVHGQREVRSLWWFVRHGPLGYPVVAALLLVVMLAWRSATRLGPPLPEATTPRRAKEEFVIAMASLDQRAGYARAAGKAMLRAHEQLARGDAERSARVAHLTANLDSAGSFGDNELVKLAADLDQSLAANLSTDPA